MIRVKKRKGEDFEDMLKRFKKACRREGLISEVQSREAYEKPCDRRRRERHDGIVHTKKAMRRRSFSR